MRTADGICGVAAVRCADGPPAVTLNAGSANENVNAAAVAARSLRAISSFRPMPKKGGGEAYHDESRICRRIMPCGLKSRNYRSGIGKGELVALGVAADY